MDSKVIQRINGALEQIDNIEHGIDGVSFAVFLNCFDKNTK